MLLQASIEIANTERWALERGEKPAPAALGGMLRTGAYEVTVVDRFHRLARRYFEHADIGRSGNGRFQPANEAGL